MTKPTIKALIIIFLSFYFNITHGQWSKITEMPTSRVGHKTCVLEDKIYIMGGSNTTEGAAFKTVEVYNPIIDEWETRSDMLTARANFAACVFNGKIYVFGGGQSFFWNPVSSVEEYDPQTDTWRFITEMPRPRMGLSACVLNDKIYIIGGADANESSYAIVDVYDPQADAWGNAANLPTPRFSLQSVVLNNKIYSIGGHIGPPWNGLYIVEQYDPLTDIWSRKSDLITGRKYSSACVLYEKIYVIGGSVYPRCYIGSVEEYDPEKDSWSEKTALPLKLTGLNAASFNDKIYVFGGAEKPPSPASVIGNVYDYNPKNDFISINIGNVEEHTLIHNEIQRDYIIFFPKNHSPGLPVVINLHGFTDNSQLQMYYSKMNYVADTAGFMVVYPNSSGFSLTKRWNTNAVELDEPKVDDLGFISNLLDTLNSKYQVDMNRIYVCGYSNGGFMTFNLLCNLGYRFAAGATVCGTLHDNIVNYSNIIRPFPVMMFNGTDDNSIPFDGSGFKWSVSKTINYWKDLNNCTQILDSVFLPDIDTSDNCNIEKIVHTNCNDENKVVLNKIINGGHHWPSGGYIWEGAGNMNQDINASEEILNFFEKYSNPLANIAHTSRFSISPKYFDLAGDTLFVNADIVNQEFHTVNVYARFYSLMNNYQDSIIIHDDGLHNDNHEADNFFAGSKYLSQLEEDFYKLILCCEDIDLDAVHSTYITKYFTTAGPIQIDEYDIKELSGGRIGLTNFVLKNNGQSLEVPNILATINIVDSTVTEIIKETNGFGDLGPGESKTVSSAFAFYPDSNATKINLQLDISSDGITYWTDSINIDLTNTDYNKILPTEYSLSHNYPNPFNPVTTIKYSIPNNSTVSLKVYDILGREVTTIVNEEQSQGQYKVRFDGSDLSSGIYFYSLQVYHTNGETGDFLETKKMIILK